MVNLPTIYGIAGMTALQLQFSLEPFMMNMFHAALNSSLVWLRVVSVPLVAIAVVEIEKAYQFSKAKPHMNPSPVRL